MTSIDNLPSIQNDQKDHDNKDEQLIQDILQDIQGATSNSESMYQRQMDNLISSAPPSNVTEHQDNVVPPPSIRASQQSPSAMSSPPPSSKESGGNSLLKLGTNVLLFVIIFILLNHPSLVNILSKIPFMIHPTTQKYTFLSLGVLGIIGGILYYYLQFMIL